MVEFAKPLLRPPTFVAVNAYRTPSAYDGTGCKSVTNLEYDALGSVQIAPRAAYAFRIFPWAFAVCGGD